MKSLPSIKKRMKVHTSGMMAILFSAFMIIIACEESNVQKYNPPSDHTISQDGYMHKTGLVQPLVNCVTCHGSEFLIGAIAAVLITSAASAQHSGSPRGKVNLGIKAGINMYKISSDDNTVYDQITGFHLGLIGHIHMDSQWAVQPELVYSSQGAKSAVTDHKLDYINVPVLLQYMFDNGFRLQAGPQLGILVKADNKNDLNSIDLGVGMGISYVVPSTGFGLDARYNHGISNINKNDAVKSFNRGVQLGVFYIFGH